MVRMAKMVKISIHAPASGATLEVVEVVRRRVFQSTLPRVERRATSTWSCCRRVFQSTLPRVERRGKIYVVCSRGAISIHAPASGATFNDQTFRPFMPISIHAPASGATRICLTFNFLSSISIHAPASGATCSSDKDRDTEPFQSTLPRVERRPVFLTDNAVFHFNPRSREWSDNDYFSTLTYRVISIHAPASGATH